VAFLVRARVRRPKVEGSRAFAGLLAGAGLAFGGAASGCGLLDWASQCSRNLGMPGCTGPMGSGGVGSGGVSSAGTGGYGSGGTGSTSASGGQGGCNDASECPPVPWGPCHELGMVTCTNRACGVTYTPGDAPSQVYGNCMHNGCDASGQMSAIADDTNVLASDNSCRPYVCATGMLNPKLVGQGMSCALQGITMGYCDVPADPSSTTPLVCAECDPLNPTTTCKDPSYQCSKGKCVPQSCTNMKQDMGETDSDCGGPQCLPCVAGLKCAVASDCFSRVCASGTCQAPSCTDNVQNGDETSIDCGGKTCPPCRVNNGCAVPTDCLSGVCKPSAPGAALVCQMPTCFDGVKNGDETGVDCGSPPDSGTACPPCAGM
jgi:hypothetical protein